MKHFRAERRRRSFKHDVIARPSLPHIRQRPGESSFERSPMMTDVAVTSSSRPVDRSSERGARLGAASRLALTLASRIWFVVAVAGQWMFASYVALFYGGAAMQ